MKRLFASVVVIAIGSVFYYEGLSSGVLLSGLGVVLLLGGVAGAVSFGRNCKNETK